MNEEFEALVLAVISEIPCGQVASYGQIAEPVSYTHLSAGLSWACAEKPGHRTAE